MMPKYCDICSNEIYIKYFEIDPFIFCSRCVEKCKHCPSHFVKASNFCCYECRDNVCFDYVEAQMKWFNEYNLSSFIWETFYACHEHQFYCSGCTISVPVHFQKAIKFNNVEFEICEKCYIRCIDLFLTLQKSTNLPKDIIKMIVYEFFRNIKIS